MSGAVDESAPVVQVVTMVLAQALRDRASDVHIEPMDGLTRVRFRIDGVLHDVLTLPVAMGGAVTSRLKVLAGMNIVERRRSQDGQFTAAVEGRDIDVRVASTGTIAGEKMVLRLLDKMTSSYRLSELGMPADTYATYSAMVRSPFGMVICAGPTGSGKTTSLYATMGELNGVDRNIMTIEDPVEYVVPSINQIQINEQAGVTFAGGLRAILRQDPDVILVGEIRDGETARIAVQSALTGHFVMTSLHATDTTSALMRFLDMDIEPYIVASAVAGVLSQRLLRRSCDQCRRRVRPDGGGARLLPRGRRERTRAGLLLRRGMHVLLPDGLSGPHRRLRADAHDAGDAQARRTQPGPRVGPQPRDRRGHPDAAPGGGPTRRGPRHHHRGGHPRDLRPVGAGMTTTQPAAERARKEPREVMPARVKGKELMHLSRQLAAFLRAGIPILDGLDLLAREASNATLRRTLAAMAEDLRQGEPLAEAFDRHPKVFPSSYRSMIRSAELSGSLDTTLDRLTVYVEREVEAKSQIRSAMTYPIVIVVLSLAVSTLLVTFVLPKFAVFFESFDKELPLPTRMLLGLSDLVRDWWWVGLGCFAHRGGRC